MRSVLTNGEDVVRDVATLFLRRVPVRALFRYPLSAEDEWNMIMCKGDALCVVGKGKGMGHSLDCPVFSDSSESTAMSV